MGRKKLTLTKDKRFTLRFTYPEFEQLKIASQELKVKPAKLIRLAVSNFINASFLRNV